MKNTATVFNIQRFSVHDGPGIRTTVFIKGCPLRCLWCHNPEAYQTKPVIMLNASKCIGCGDCVSACKAGLHSFDEEKHLIDRDKCTLCAECVNACIGALTLCGKEMSADEVLAEVIRDRSFYENSGGGMTLSGGEPLAHADFSRELLKGAKEAEISTAVETSGFAPRESLDKIIPYTDLFLFDFKECDEERHRLYTGASGIPILENLRYLDALGKRIVLRCPIIPGYNDRPEHLKAIGTLAEELRSVERVDIEPYHPLGISKSEAIGQAPAVKITSLPRPETISEWISEVQKYTTKTVVKS